MKRWLARLAMSFVVIAAVLLWEAYRGAQRGLETWRVVLDLAAAAAAVALAVAGMREKHRPQQTQNASPPRHEEQEED